MILFKSQAGVFMRFSITSTVLGGIIIICYGISSTFYGPRRARAIIVIILILGIIEFVIGLWAAVSLCLMKPCTCCYDTAPQPVSHPRERVVDFTAITLTTGPFFG